MTSSPADQSAESDWRTVPARSIPHTMGNERMTGPVPVTAKPSL